MACQARQWGSRDNKADFGTSSGIFIGLARGPRQIVDQGGRNRL